MLLLTRRAGEAFTVTTPAGDCRIVIVRSTPSRVEVGIDAPKDWTVKRDDMKKEGA